MNFVATFVILTASLGFYMSSNNAAPTITRDLNATPSKSAWLLIADPHDSTSIYIANGNMEYLSMGAQGDLSISTANHNDMNHKWILEKNPNDTSRYNIKNVSTGMYLDWANGALLNRNMASQCGGWGVSVNPTHPLEVQYLKKK